MAKKDPLKAALGNLDRLTKPAADGKTTTASGNPDAGPALGTSPASLIDRRNALSEIGDGSRKDVVHRLVDPDIVRPWAHHNRSYADLTPVRVADLIEGLRAQGRQEFPAIVRRLEAPTPEGYEYEFVCGARRHFAVSYLRANGYADFRYLIEVRQLTDEEAFRLSDVENRDREDLSDYERARDYLAALDLYYGGEQKRMAERLEMSRSYLSNFLDLGRLPPRIVAAFGSVQEIRVHHSRTLKPLLKGQALAQLLERADEIAKFQEAQRAADKPLMQATVVLGELKTNSAPQAERKPRQVEIEVMQGLKPLKLVQRGAQATVSFPVTSAENREVFLKAMGRAWDEMWKD